MQRTHSIHHSNKPTRTYPRVQESISTANAHHRITTAMIYTMHPQEPGYRECASRVRTTLQVSTVDILPGYRDSGQEGCGLGGGDELW
ncbi:predicted protein [Plenodomus lingam JN3]|uniref:Predicted protein n=1 Tax=Leptosphaeria maculans (strain JN3 / isolate v23.1.3 / race Av1-4-5-6-7-8) TaxID=985895 RepID=E4ZWD1_LEPMJ|nr:predicted protein [Plenodomus lingam JN3]CBX95907.1 predicted protein [Plenodomus lingam JN3]